MTPLRVGTRGSELALRQTRWVCDRLRSLDPGLIFEEVTIQTHGDTRPDQPLDAEFPSDGFVGAIERAVQSGQVDFAVHSYKDLPTMETIGLCVAAVPMREVAHDVLVTNVSMGLGNVPKGFRIGTSSPRRAAQIRRVADVSIRPLRGNVPTRIAKVRSGELDGVIIAAAGIRRLGLSPPFVLNLPMDSFVPAPAQGALAVQARADDAVVPALARIEDPISRRAVETERAFLRALHAGCHTPVGAMAVNRAGRIRLHGQLFSDDGVQCFEGVVQGDDPLRLGETLATRLVTFRDGSVAG